MGGTEGTTIFIQRNRDNVGLFLRLCDDGDYALHADEGKEYVLEYAGVNYERLADDAIEYDNVFNGKKVKIISLDPGGGPYMSVGSEINGHVIKRIYSDGKHWKISFED